MIRKVEKDVHLYESIQEVQGGGSRNCMDWILDSYAKGARHVIIYLPKARAPLVKVVKHYANKVVSRLHGIGVHVVSNKAALKVTMKQLGVEFY